MLYSRQISPIKDLKAHGDLKLLFVWHMQLHHAAHRGLRGFRSASTSLSDCSSLLGVDSQKLVSRASRSIISLPSCCTTTLFPITRGEGCSMLFEDASKFLCWLWTERHKDSSIRRAEDLWQFRPFPNKRWDGYAVEKNLRCDQPQSDR